MQKTTFEANVKAHPSAYEKVYGRIICVALAPFIGKKVKVSVEVVKDD